MKQSELNNPLKEAIVLLLEELKKSKEREKKLEHALEEVFPLALYKLLRPDVAATLKTEKEIIEHYIEQGVADKELKREINKTISTLRQTPQQAE